MFFTRSCSFLKAEVENSMISSLLHLSLHTALERSHTLYLSVTNLSSPTPSPVSELSSSHISTDYFGTSSLLQQPSPTIEFSNPPRPYNHGSKSRELQ